MADERLDRYPHAMEIDPVTNKPMPKVSAGLSADVSEVTLQNNATAVGNGTILNVNGQATALFAVTGAFVASVSFEGSINDVDWFPILAAQLGSGTIANSATTTGLYKVAVTGLKSVRSRVSTYTSGTVKVIGRATAVDSSNKSIQIAGIDSTGGVIKVLLDGFNAIQPIDIQSRYAQTIQTHNAVSVPASGFSSGNYVSCDGFYDIAINLKNDTTSSNSVDIWWSVDGITDHGSETIIATGSRQYASNSIPIKAPYFKIVTKNGDAALAHTMSVWAYLKA